MNRDRDLNADEKKWFVDLKNMTVDRLPPDRRMDLRDFVAREGISTVLEFGTGAGMSSTFFALGGCEVVTCEIMRPGHVMAPGVTLSDCRCQGFYEQAGEGRILQVICDTSNPPFPESARFDLVFIDSSHELSHTKREIAFAKKVAAKWIAFDDYSFYGVKPAVDGLAQELGTSIVTVGYDIVALKV